MKTQVVKYIIRKSRNKQTVSPFIPKQDGKPTIENLSKWRDGFNNSLKKGGANEHLGLNEWLLCGLEIYNQLTGEIVCTYNAPAFELVG